MVTFERVAEAKVVYFTRFSLEGQVQAEGTLELPTTKNYTEHSKRSTPTDTNGWVTVWFYSTIWQGGSKRFYDTAKVIRVQYKLGCNVLRFKKDSFDFPTEWDLTVSDMFFWSDIAYCYARYYDHASLNVIDFSKSFMTLTVMEKGEEFELVSGQGWRERRVFRIAGGMLRSLFLGDERFLVNACELGFYVLAFDKNHGMTETDAGYKEKRKEAKKNREGPWAWNWSGYD